MTIAKWWLVMDRNQQTYRKVREDRSEERIRPRFHTLREIHNASEDDQIEEDQELFERHMNKVMRCQE